MIDITPIVHFDTINADCDFQFPLSRQLLWQEVVRFRMSWPILFYSSINKNQEKSWFSTVSISPPLRFDGRIVIVKDKLADPDFIQTPNEVMEGVQRSKGSISGSDSFALSRQIWQNASMRERWSRCPPGVSIGRRNSHANSPWWPAEGDWAACACLLGHQISSAIWPNEWAGGRMGCNL